MTTATRSFQTLIFCSLLGYVCSGSAANDNPSQMSLIERAHLEVQQPGKIRSRPNDVEVSESILSLKDPRPEVEVRRFKFGLALGVQSFRARGVTGNDFTTAQFDLGQNGETILPTLEFGIRSHLLTQDRWLMDWGLVTHFAYTSQRAKAEFESEFVESKVRLNTMMWSAGPQLSGVVARLPWLRPVVGAEWGRLTYTQVSSNELANANERASYFGLGGGFDIRLGSTWNLVARYTHRELTAAKSNVGIQPDNFEVGTKIVW